MLIVSEAVPGYSVLAFPSQLKNKWGLVGLSQREGPDMTRSLTFTIHSASFHSKWDSGKFYIKSHHYSSKKYFSNSLIMHEVINQLPGPIWVTWIPLYTPLKNRWNQACLNIQTHAVGYPNTCVWKSIRKSNAVLEQMFITFPDKLLFQLPLAFKFTLRLMRFTFTEQFVNIAKHCGQFFLDCTWDLLGKLQLFFRSSHSVKAIFEFMRFPAW